MYRKHFIITAILITGIAACNKDVADYFTFTKPAEFPQPAYHFETNTVTRAGFELGRKLFYDPILSSNNTISCSSCHIQTAAFTHHGHSVSHGIFDRLGTRNSPPIMNLAWSPTYMWDGGIFDLDMQPIAPITNHVEMDDTMANVIKKLQASSVYPPLFKKAFGSSEVTSALFLKALSQFMVMCVSDNAKYDSVKRGQAIFTASEQAGYELYKQKCSACHTEPLFTDYSFRNNGLSISTVDDKGRYNVTLNEEDKYRFKVPSLRNLYYTPPYMHDGRFLTLDAVLNHYTGEVQRTPNLDPILAGPAQAGIAITAEEKENILAFLQTLNDRYFVTNPRLAAP